MEFNNHYKLEGLHAPFSASQCSWLRYDSQKAIDVYLNKKAAERGTKLHNWAKQTIDLGIKQPRSKNTLSAYVNDAIGYKMKTEVVLFYSYNFFGTTDAISFKDNMLRIHDLKTGTIPAKIEQLEIYAALFCLEYRIEPKNISIELRIYQNNEVLVHVPKADEIKDIMVKIIELDDILTKINTEENGL